jgi:Ca2+-binding RTX toxin-like protein
MPTINQSNFTFNGTTTIVSGASPILRFDTNAPAGNALLNSAITLSNDTSFSTYFQFQISDSAGVSDTDGLGGDGLAFVIQTSKTAIGGTGSNLGYAGITNSIAIEFDTYLSNSNNDINGNHVGLDLNGNINSVEQTAVANRMNNGNIWNVWIDYNGLTNLLEVRLSETNNQRPNTSILSYTLDLPSILNSPNAFFGFSSGQASATGKHDIIDWDLAPVITSAATATFAENGTGTVYTVTTNLDAGTTLTYSLSGNDADLFNINNGIVTFKTAPNFELPSDNGANNVYDINVIASDGTLSTTQAVAITVTNVNDDVQSALSYTLNSSQLDLILTGNDNINGTGNSLNNTIFGNTGNNLLSGGAGADSLFGGAGDDTLMGGVGADSLTGGTGNDWYWVDDAGDSVIELANEGTDKVFTTINYTLTANVEDLALQEIAGNINGTGNGLNNTITDNTKDNLLDGGAGNDIIRASGGNDTLTGGLGTDTLTGGLGNDRFVYTDLTHSLLAGIDSIKDFNNDTETDRFVVSTARSVFNTVGVVSGLNATAISNALTTINFGADAAALFTIGSKSYVAINDGTAGFSAASDAIVEITGYKGTLSTSSFVTVTV